MKSSTDELMAFEKLEANREKLFASFLGSTDWSPVECQLSAEIKQAKSIQTSQRHSSTMYSAQLRKKTKQKHFYFFANAHFLWIFRASVV